ncbi:hypothetical protein [Ktedonobacter robiniae]|uniref:Uncharacterized protein n=1 Tax=Ktedonobacter robiniae TaxID=2778365 RepID=A0ABQ3V0A2_9CHLR|nr:hypothetical protein [Ktedonobacter robiniae]GHO58338.1 hypothetical protein KSB_68130 [Ktedonobacter robiniae]
MSHYDHFFRRFRRSRATRLVLFCTPMALIFVELGHPVLDAQHPIAMLQPILVGWITIHRTLLLETPAFEPEEE